MDMTKITVWVTATDNDAGLCPWVYATESEAEDGLLQAFDATREELEESGETLCEFLDGKKDWLDSYQIDSAEIELPPIYGAGPQMLEALRNARNVIAQALNNGAWGDETSDEVDSIDEVQSVLADIDAAISAAAGAAPEPCQHSFEQDEVMIPVCTQCGIEGEDESEGDNEVTEELGNGWRYRDYPGQGEG
jgi:hypothetical protein